MRRPCIRDAVGFLCLPIPGRRRCTASTANRALSGARRPTRGGLGAEYWAAPEGPTLPEILARDQVLGWAAEGLVRLYLAQGLVIKFGGRFERLDVGPATASRVCVHASFRPGGHGHDPAQIEGIVVLRA